MDGDDQVTSLLHQVDALFEPSQALHILLQSKHEQFLAESEPTDHGPRVCEDTIRFIYNTLIHAREKELDAILNAHPRLGEPKNLSESSKREQASLGQVGELRGLNEEYERTFPGLRYVVFVNGRSREKIMQDMRARIARTDMREERKEGIQAMCDIARDRLKSLFPA